MIKAVIFDLDNTLYNFDAANEFGIRALAAYTEPVFGWDYPRMKDLYEESREKLTERMGDVGSAHNRLLRFQNLLEEKKLPLHPHALEMAKAYWRGVLDNMAPSPGAREIMEELRRMGVRIGLGTDMTAYMQYEKLIRLGLMEYMDFIVSSEEAGTDKPGNAFFMLCARKAGCLPGECLFIGDNIVRDYGGAAAAGMQARWFIPPWKQKNHLRHSETPYADKPIRAQPGMAQTSTAQISTEQISAEQTSTAKSGTVHPGIAQPGMAQISTAQPGTLHPDRAKTSTERVDIEQPGTVHPGIAQHGTDSEMNGKGKPASGFLTAADGLFPKEASKDLEPAFARALQDPGAPESRVVLDAVPRIFALSEIPEIVRRQRS